MEQNLIEFMTSGRHGTPISVMGIKGRYVVAIYQGQLSPFDFRVVYRENKNGKWTQPRQPKHIHWGVDLLIKQLHDKELTKEFLKHMQQLWGSIIGVSSNEERKGLMQKINFDDIKEFLPLTFGFYSIEFIYATMYLLMFQEKTNNPNAFMFKSILDALVDDKDLYNIIGTATFSGRK